jgi:DtxR family Mn-dependent transcriptional regulator
VTALIDTTEMYLRTVFELEEEGVVPLRARIAERLHHSGPTVSETVSRLQREGLLHVDGDRHVELSASGRRIARSVMRKHRLAELLLTEVIGLDWEQVHVEACRWEHVMSDAVERRLVDLLGHPTHCPHGNPIPELDTGDVAAAGPAGEPLVTLRAAAAERATAVVRRISEQLQVDPEVMAGLRRDGLQPGRVHRLSVTAAGTVRAEHDDGSVEVPLLVAEHVFVSVAG